MKKIFMISGAAVAVLLSAVIVCGIILYNKPGVKFLLVMSDAIRSPGITCIEKTVRVNNDVIPMMVFTSRQESPRAYYFLLHGFTPESYKHPMIIKLAKGICAATGRTVFIPLIRNSIGGTRTIKDMTEEIKNIYLALKKEYPGRYDAFGSCLAGTGLLIAFNKMPVEEYPDRIFLFGPFFTGKLLVDFYNKARPDEIDYIVKMANAMNSKNYNVEEKKLLSKAIISTKPGRTDRDEMRTILGDALFKKVDESKVDNQEFIDVDKHSIFTEGKKIPNSDFYIIHSTSDDIIPYTQGMALQNYLLQCGARSRFLGTNLFGHSQKNISLLTYSRELRDMISFLDDLFRENGRR
jgi:hypothetical protein